MTAEVGRQSDSAPLERYLRMAAISGFLALREYKARYPRAHMSEAVSSLRRQFFDTAHFDYEAATKIESVVPDIPLVSTAQALQIVLAKLIEHHQPWWLRLAPLGRERMLSVLADDQRQCFAAAHLTTSDPDATAVLWWDQLAQTARSERDGSKLALGRTGERLSLEHERVRLQQLGINLLPRWVALDNNSLGYDILSYNPGPFEPINRLVEVKASASFPIAFHVTRNEWEVAIRAGGSYVLHIWHVPSKTLHELSLESLAPHVPSDNGNGKWESFAVTLMATSEQM